MRDAGMNNSTMALFAAEILITCLVVVGLFWLLLRRNKQFRQLETTLSEQAGALTEAFLERELIATQALVNASKDDELIAILVRLRGFWLEAEKRALVEHGSQASDHHRIAEIIKSSRLYAQRPEILSSEGGVVQGAPN